MRWFSDGLKFYAEGKEGMPPDGLYNRSDGVLCYVCNGIVFSMSKLDCSYSLTKVEEHKQLKGMYDGWYKDNCSKYWFFKDGISYTENTSGTLRKQQVMYTFNLGLTKTNCPWLDSKLHLLGNKLVSPSTVYDNRILTTKTIIPLEEAIYSLSLYPATETWRCLDGIWSRLGDKGTTLPNGWYKDTNSKYLYYHDGKLWTEGAGGYMFLASELDKSLIRAICPWAADKYYASTDGYIYLKLNDTNWWTARGVVQREEAELVPNLSLIEWDWRISHGEEE